MRRIVAINVLVSVLTAGVVALTLAGGGAVAEPAGNSGYIRRFAANFNAWGDPPEISTSVPATGTPPGSGGVVIYEKKFFTAADINVLYVTISAVGDTHDGAQMQLACLLGDDACNPGPNPIGGAPNGWVTVMRHKNYNDGDYELGPTPFTGDGGGGAGDLHDNVVAYTWCTPINGGGGTRTVRIKLAADRPDDGPVPGSSETDPVLGRVFLEGIHFFVDGSRVANAADRCTKDTTPLPPAGIFP